MMVKLTETAKNAGRIENFPNDIFFRTILENAQKVHQTIFRDKTLGIDANYVQLLTDVVHARRTLEEQLQTAILSDSRVISDSRPYIFVAAPIDYEFIVATLAILAIGAAFVPLC